MKAIFTCLILCCLNWCCLGGRLAAQEIKPEIKPAPADGEAATSKQSAEIVVFQKPARYLMATRMMAGLPELATTKQHAAAEQVCLAAENVAPFHPRAAYNLACMQALQGKKRAALASLERAVIAGFSSAEDIRDDEDLTSLRDDPKFAELVKQVETEVYKPTDKDLEPAEVKNGIAQVTKRSGQWSPIPNLVRIQLAAGQPAKNADVIQGHGEVGKLLQTWFAEGTAAGNFGDYYDNCDRDHSNLAYEQFPQLTRIEYAEDIRKHTGYGVQLTNIFAAPGLRAVIGNSSTAQTAGPLWRGNLRLAYIQPGGIETLFVQYLNNHLYFYPEHRDHDEGHNGQGDGHGDVHAANIPYVIISQGSSGSDRPFMDAVACTLAAFRPEVKERLAEKQMLMPAVQMILRRSNKPVKTDDDYLAGAAHPTVFDSKNLDVQRMVELAHSLRVDSLPPVAMLRVEEEEEPVVGRDYFDVRDREKLFDTPMCVARIWRSTQQQRKVTLIAKGIDANGKPLKYHWVVLRGDKSKIQIKPQGDGSRAEVALTWHGRAPIQPDSKLESNRIDIGVFAHNGIHYSAPAFFCVNTLDNEERVYDPQGRIKSIVYTGADEKGNYVDPAFDLPKSWRDDYRYNEAGNLLGWTRTKGDRKEEFTPDGLLIAAKDENGLPTLLKYVTYLAVPRDSGVNTLEALVGEAVEKK